MRPSPEVKRCLEVLYHALGAYLESTKPRAPDLSESSTARSPVNMYRINAATEPVDDVAAPDKVSSVSSKPSDETTTIAITPELKAKCAFDISTSKAPDQTDQARGFVQFFDASTEAEANEEADDLGDAYGSLIQGGTPEVVTQLEDPAG